MEMKKMMMKKALKNDEKIEKKEVKGKEKEVKKTSKNDEKTALAKAFGKAKGKY